MIGKADGAWSQGCVLFAFYVRSFCKEDGIKSQGGVGLQRWGVIAKGCPRNAKVGYKRKASGVKTQRTPYRRLSRCHRESLFALPSDYTFGL